MPVKEAPTLSRSRRDRALVLLLQLVATLVLAALVHLATILVLPSRSEHDAYAKVVALVGDRGLLHTVAGPEASDGALAYRDPAIATAFCLYDLRVAPVRVSIDVAEAAYVAVSFHSRLGVAYYGLTNRSASNEKVSVNLMTPRQLAEAEARDNGDAGLTDLRVPAPEAQGFVEVQALATAPSAMAAAEVSARKLICMATTSP